ncbi:MAG: virulence RhuM family protein [Treponema sp.]|nr:virulence RhuM family protein [Treponema sp.]
MTNLLQFLIYRTPQEDININVGIKDETAWLTQKVMAELFDVQVPAISKHLSNIYDDGELNREATISILETVQKEGNREIMRKMEFYNLDAIISVGYRVNSAKATQFRIWATKTLKEFITKGFVLDDERLKQGKTIFGTDYFRELLDRVRSIRASERRIWQQITDIFAECSIDYNKNSQLTQDFFAMVQNKFHFAIAGLTAAEIIYSKADKSKENMGLTTWKNSPDGRILKSDVTIAKNYLSEKEIRRLERAVTGYFDYIEDLIEQENTFTMEEFAKSVNEFLSFRKFKILSDKGKISKEKADEKAESEYDEFNKTQKIVSDFDKEVKKMLENKIRV